MHLRRDALAGAAEVVSEVERYCRETTDLVGVVGSLTTVPNAVNVVPAEVRFSVELRSGTDEVRELAGRRIATFIEHTAKARKLKASLQRNYAQPSAQCDGGLSSILDKAFAANGLRSFRLVSGATHDASAMADLTPIAMLFVRCLHGVSHHHEESITAQDAGIAARVIISFLQELGNAESLWGGESRS